MEYPSSRSFPLKHAANKALEIDVAMIQFIRYRTLQLDLIGLKAVYQCIVVAGDSLGFLYSAFA